MALETWAQTPAPSLFFCSPLKRYYRANQKSFRFLILGGPTNQLENRRKKNRLIQIQHRLMTHLNQTNKQSESLIDLTNLIKTKD